MMSPARPPSASSIARCTMRRPSTSSPAWTRALAGAKNNEGSSGCSPIDSTRSRHSTCNARRITEAVVKDQPGQHSRHAEREGDAVASGDAKLAQFLEPDFLDAAAEPEPAHREQDAGGDPHGNFVPGLAREPIGDAPGPLPTGSRGPHVTELGPRACPHVPLICLTKVARRLEVLRDERGVCVGAPSSFDQRQQEPDVAARGRL